jgi:dTDP-4-dehydrorhamnose 3,5-epimerase
MKIRETSLEGLWVIEPKVFGDERGYFMETYQRERYRKAGIDRAFVQDNLSFSTKGCLRGLHFQVTRPQAKLVQVLAGEVFDVAVDIRPGSPTFGRWLGVRLSDRKVRQLFVPEGFAHGFMVLSETAYFSYKCSDYYVPGDEGGIRWSDPDIAIEWPMDPTTLSDKDARFPLLSELSPERLYAPERP